MRPTRGYMVWNWRKCGGSGSRPRKPCASLQCSHDAARNMRAGAARPVLRRADGARPARRAGRWSQVRPERWASAHRANGRPRQNGQSRSGRRSRSSAEGHEMRVICGSRCWKSGRRGISHLEPKVGSVDRCSAPRVALVIVSVAPMRSRRARPFRSAHGGPPVAPGLALRSYSGRRSTPTPHLLTPRLRRCSARRRETPPSDHVEKARSS